MSSGFNLIFIAKAVSFMIYNLSSKTRFVKLLFYVSHTRNHYAAFDGHWLNNLGRVTSQWNDEVKVHDFPSLISVINQKSIKILQIYFRNNKIQTTWNITIYQQYSLQFKSTSFDRKIPQHILQMKMLFYSVFSY